MKEKYTLEDVKLLMEKGDFNELNRAIKTIKESPKRDTEDIKVLKYLSESDKIAAESREELTRLMKEYIEEIKQSNNEEQIKLLENIEKSPEGSKNDIVDVTTAGIVTSAVINQNKEEFDIAKMRENSLKARLEEKGLTVKEIKDPTTGHPSITFEINYGSKAYIDNLMLRLHENKELGFDFSLTKIDASKEELFTVSINRPDLTIEEIIKENEKMLNTVETIVQATDKDKKEKYEEMMPDGLKHLKEPFNNDAPDIPKGDFKITCINDEGVSKYYVMSSSKETAEEVTKRIGFEQADYLGGGIIELNTEGKNMDDTKLDVASNTTHAPTNEEERKVDSYEQAKVKKIGTMPVKPSTDSAFTNIGNILLVVLLVISVILIVGMMVI